MLCGQVVESRWRTFQRVVPLRLEAGEVRILLAEPYPHGWRQEKAQYDKLLAQREREGKRGYDPGHASGQAPGHST